MVDPKAKELLDFINSVPEPDPYSLTPQQHRDRASLLKAPSQLRDLHEVFDCKLSSEVGEFSIRCYRPSDNATGVIIYFHGGGFVLGSTDSHDHLCRELSHISGYNVISVDYHLAPEYPYPAPVADARAVFQWLQLNADSLGFDLSNVVVAGDSAGANIATVCAIEHSNWTDIMIKFQILWYPCVDKDFSRESYQTYKEGFFLSSRLMQWFWDQYSSGYDRAPNLTPIDADLRGVCSTAIVTASCDPLRDEGYAYYQKLKSQGVDAHYAEYKGQIHGFISMFNLFEKGREALEWSIDQLRAY